MAWLASLAFQYATTHGETELAKQLQSQSNSPLNDLAKACYKLGLSLQQLIAHH
jgi:hypothetical protein